MKIHFDRMGYYLPEDVDEQTRFMRNMHHMICQANPAWPANVDHARLYADFFNAVEAGHAPRPTKSAFAYAESFREWAKHKNLLQAYGDQRQLPGATQSKKPPTAAQIKAVYGACTSAELQESAANFTALLQLSPSLGQLPQFYQHRRALVNELSKRGLPVNPTLAK